METSSSNGGRSQGPQREEPARSGLPESQEEDGGRGAPQQPDRPQQDRSSGERRGPEQAPPRRSRDPFDAVMRLSREMDQLVESFFGNRFSFPRFAGSRGNAADIWSPRVDVRQAADSITITAELPGVSREAIQIEATADGIAISGERQQTREEGGSDRGYQLSERSYGSFYRNIPLPENANVDEARANMREGLLEITVPMKPGPGRRRIEISG